MGYHGNYIILCHFNQHNIFMASRLTTPPPAYTPFAKDNLQLSIVDCFERWVRETPEAVAIDHNRVATNYRTLSDNANKVAGTLRSKVPKDQIPIPFLMDQGDAVVACILGILKSNHIYVPLDGRQGEAFLLEVINELKPPFIIADSAHEPIARNLKVPVLLYQSILNYSKQDSEEHPPGPDSLAYVYFTSGTTGKPKGVVDSHRNVLHNVLRYTNTLKICREDRLSMIQHPSFSGTVSSMFAAVCNGAILCPHNLDRLGLTSLPDWISNQGITIFHSVPSIFRYLTEFSACFDGVRVIRLEGDKATANDAALFQQNTGKDCTLVNGLGATECGLVRQYFIRHGDNIPQVLPIGYPVPDVEVSLIDTQGNELGEDEVGEILVKSKYLALGYWNDQERTELSFGQRTGDRVYHTGDLGRWGPGKCLEYTGRKDRQIKIYGQTVNLSDLEASLLTLEGLAEAAVKSYTDRYQETKMAAFLVAEPGQIFDVAEFKRLLADKFPNFMVPTFIKFLPQIPKGKNGKIDLNSLPFPESSTLESNTPFISPQTPLEHTMSGLWSRVLDLQQVSLSDNFLALGGDSIRAARLISAVKAMGINIKIADLYDHSDLRSLVNFIEGKTNKTDSRLSNVKNRGKQQRQMLK